MKTAIELLFEAVKHSHEVQEDDAWYAWDSEEAEEFLEKEEYGPWIAYNKEKEEAYKAKQKEREIKRAKEEVAFIERSKELLLLDNLSPKEISELIK